MLVSQTILSEFKQNLRNNIKGYLRVGKSWSDEKIAVLDPFIDELIGALDADARFADFIIRLVDAFNEHTPNQFNSLLADKNSEKDSFKQKLDSENFKVQDSKKTLEIKEPSVPLANKTSPKTLFDANYTLKEDYPDSYGFIDSVKNWLKINKKNKSAQIVHSSGTLIKVDKEGNMTMHIKGGLKQVIEGDYTLFVKGSMDQIVQKDLFIGSGGDFESRIDGKSEQKVKSEITLKAPKINLN